MICGFDGIYMVHPWKHKMRNAAGKVILSFLKCTTNLDVYVNVMYIGCFIEEWENDDKCTASALVDDGAAKAGSVYSVSIKAS